MQNKHYNWNAGSVEVGVDLHNVIGEKTRIGYNCEDELFYVDRRSSQRIEIRHCFNEVHITDNAGVRQEIHMDIYVDSMSIEVNFEKVNFLWVI